jgi:hypothetical protein
MFAFSVTTLLRYSTLIKVSKLPWSLLPLVLFDDYCFGELFSAIQPMSALFVTEDFQKKK